MWLNIYYDKDSNTVYLHDDTKGWLKFPFERYGFIPDKNGKFRTIDGIKVSPTKNLYQKQIYESDVPVDVRVLIDEYLNETEPSPHHVPVILDIEVATDKGFSTPKEAYAPITAITLYDMSKDKYHTLVLSDETSVNDTAKIFGTEEELLLAFLDSLDEIKPTMLIGWNSDEYDIPYIYNRIKNALGTKYVNRLSPIGIVEERGYGDITIAGISCLDYLQLYKKFTPNEKESYSLDNISKLELGRGKVEYTGNLNDLYTQDINKFIEYNIQDVRLIKELDDKLRYLELTKDTCYECHVPLENILMPSSYLEGASLVFLRQHKIVVNNKKKKTEFKLKQEYKKGTEIIELIEPQTFLPKFGTIRVYKSKSTFIELEYNQCENNQRFYLTAPLKETILPSYKMHIALQGAYVKDPEMGLHKWLIDCDLTSLYPHIIISLNISPETKVGRCLFWDPDYMLKKENRNYVVNLKNERKEFHTFAQFHKFLTDNKYSIASNGVMYDMKKKGFIPIILETWFDQRDRYKKLMKEAKVAKNKSNEIYYWIKQYTQKIKLNTFYGVMVLGTFRFNDIENAEAVTSTGRTVIQFSERSADKWYSNMINEHIHKTIYCDTDSIFLSFDLLLERLHPEAKEDADIIPLMKKYITDLQNFINRSYTALGQHVFNIETHKFHIKQEIIAKSGLWLAKKRYALWVVNKEGFDCDDLEVKGIDLIRSDFPISFRFFMEGMVKSILREETKDVLDDKLREFKTHLREKDITEVMSISSVKNLDEYESEDRGKFKALKGTPVAVKAALAYNDLLEYYNNVTTEKIKKGQKLRWIPLTQNNFNIDVCALKGYDDNENILTFVKKYADIDEIFQTRMFSKINDFYTAIGWGIPIMNNQMSNFFEF